MISGKAGCSDRGVWPHLLATAALLITYGCATAPHEGSPAAPVAADLVQGTGTMDAMNSWIAYVETRDVDGKRNFRLLVSNAAGDHQHVVAASHEPIMSPSWSPDGKRLAYAAFNRGQSGIYVQEIQTGKLSLLVSERGINGAPTWSPDGTKIAVTLSFEKNPDIYLIDLATGARRRITEDPSIDTEATWSPDGNKLAFVSDRQGQPDIYLQDLAGGAPVPLKIPVQRCEEPRFSPDGKFLAMAATDDAGHFRIALFDLASGAFRYLTSGPLDERPSFSPDGSWLLYESSVAGSNTLKIIDLEGHQREALQIGAGNLLDPVWAPH